MDEIDWLKTMHKIYLSNESPHKTLGISEKSILEDIKREVEERIETLTKEEEEE